MRPNKTAEERPIMTMTAREFTAELEKAITMVASGEKEEIRFSTGMITANVSQEEQDKLTTSYMRTTLNRVPEVKAVGKVSIKTVTDDDGLTQMVITINRNPRKKQLTTDDLDVLQAKWQAKFIKHLLNTQPRITDLDGDKLAGAAIALERFAEMLKDMIKEEA